MSTSVVTTDEKITTGQAALILSVSAPTIIRLGDEGKLGSVEVRESGHRRYQRSAVLAYGDQLLREKQERLDAARSVAS